MLGANEEKQIGDPVAEKAASADELCAEVATHESHSIGLVLGREGTRGKRPAWEKV